MPIAITNILRLIDAVGLLGLMYSGLLFGDCGCVSELGFSATWAFAF